MLTSRHLGPITNDYTETKLGEVKVDINVDDPVVLALHSRSSRPRSSTTLRRRPSSGSFTTMK